MIKMTKIIKLTKWQKFGQHYIGLRQRRIYIFDDFAADPARQMSFRVDDPQQDRKVPKEGFIDKFSFTCTLLEWQEMTRVLTMWEG